MPSVLETCNCTQHMPYKVNSICHELIINTGADNLIFLKKKAKKLTFLWGHLFIEIDKECISKILNQCVFQIPYECLMKYVEHPTERKNLTDKKTNKYIIRLLQNSMFI